MGVRNLVKVTAERRGYFDALGVGHRLGVLLNSATWFVAIILGRK